MQVTMKVAAIIFNKQNEILLIKECYEKDEELKWNLIKGTYDNPDETIVDCVKREIKEEAGLVVENVALRKIYHYGDASNPRVLFVFFVNDFKGSISVASAEDQNQREENIVSARWFKKDDLKNISADEFMAPYVCHVLNNLDADLNKNAIEVLKI